MSHVLTFNFSSAGNAIFDLRRADPTGVQSGAAFYHATRISVSAIKAGASAGTFIVAPVDVTDNASAPTAATLALPTIGNAGGLAYVDSTVNPRVDIGIPFARGYSQDNYREPTASHLIVTCSAVGILQVVVD